MNWDIMDHKCVWIKLRMCVFVIYVASECPKSVCEQVKLRLTGQ